MHAGNFLSRKKVRDRKDAVGSKKDGDDSKRKRREARKKEAEGEENIPKPATFDKDTEEDLEEGEIIDEVLKNASAARQETVDKKIPHTRKAHRRQKRFSLPATPGSVKRTRRLYRSRIQQFSLRGSRYT